MESWNQGLSCDQYISQSIYKEELEKVFRSNWLYFCPSDLVQNENYYLRELANQPIVVARDISGNLSGFINVCPHRGASLLTDKSGRIKNKIVCPFHGLSFNSFTKRKTKEVSQDIVKGYCKGPELNRIHVFEMHGLVFVHLGKNPDLFFDYYSGIGQDVDQAFAHESSQYRYSHEMVLTGNFNWKLFVEVYQECFHCPTVHKGLRRDFLLSSYSVKNKTNYSQHSCKRKRDSIETGEEPGSWFWLYPNTGLPIYQDTFYALSINPIEVNKTELCYSFFYKASLPKNFESFVAFIGELGSEDVAICEQVQENLERRSIVSTYVQKSRENGVAAFHESLRSDLYTLEENPEPESSVRTQFISNSNSLFS